MRHSYSYLFGKLNTVFASNVSHAEQLALAVKVLEEIIALHQEFMFYHMMTGTSIATTKNGKIDFAALDKIDTEDKKEQLAIIDKLNEQGANIVSYTLLQGLRVRKCRHCGKYFVLKSKHETFYCDRIASKNKSCKVIGNKLEYQKKVAADEMGKADALQRQWSKQAQKMRKAYLEGCVSAAKFGAWINSP